MLAQQKVLTGFRAMDPTKLTTTTSHDRIRIGCVRAALGTGGDHAADDHLHRTRLRVAF